MLHSVTAGAVLQTIRITVKCLHEETQNILLSCIHNETWFSFIVFRLSSLNWSAKTCWNSNFDTAYWWFMMNINMHWTGKCKVPFIEFYNCLWRWYQRVVLIFTFWLYCISSLSWTNHLIVIVQFIFYRGSTQTIFIADWIGSYNYIFMMIFNKHCRRNEFWSTLLSWLVRDIWEHWTLDMV